MKIKTEELTNQDHAEVCYDTREEAEANTLALDHTERTKRIKAAIIEALAFSPMGYPNLMHHCAKRRLIAYYHDNPCFKNRFHLIIYEGRTYFEAHEELVQEGIISRGPDPENTAHHPRLHLNPYPYAYKDFEF